MENRNFISAVENARIIFRNFSGEERMYNKKGDRNFTLVLTPEKAEELRNLGYNVKTRPSREEGDENQYLLAVSVSYKIRPPKIVLINGKTKIDLSEDTVGELDYTDIEYIDLTIRPYHWELQDGRTGVKAYLNSMYVTAVEDQFADKYADDEEAPF